MIALLCHLVPSSASRPMSEHHGSTSSPFDTVPETCQTKLSCMPLTQGVGPARAVVTQHNPDRSGPGGHLARPPHQRERREILETARKYSKLTSIRPRKYNIFEGDHTTNRTIRSMERMTTAINGSWSKASTRVRPAPANPTPVWATVFL